MGVDNNYWPTRFWGNHHLSLGEETGWCRRLSGPLASWLLQFSRNLEPYIGWPFVLGLFLSGIVLWVVYYLIFPTRRPQSGQPSSDKFLPTLGKGFLTLLAAPLAILLLFITLIGIPLGMLLLVICIVILCLSKIIVGDYIGRLAFKKFGWQGNWAFFAAFVVALLFLKAVTSIPMVGFFISLIIASTAMGLVIAWLIRYRQGSLTPPASLTRLSNIL